MESLKKENLLTDDEASHLLDLKQEAMNLKGLKLHKFRRRIRNRLFRIRQGRKEFDNGLKKMIESQFEPDMNWKTYTFNWDVAPIDPLKIISPFEWESNGGTFEDVMVQGDDGVIRKQRICSPTAFTHQE